MMIMIGATITPTSVELPSLESLSGVKVTVIAEELEVPEIVTIVVGVMEILLVIVEAVVVVSLPATDLETVVLIILLAVVVVVGGTEISHHNDLSEPKLV